MVRGGDCHQKWLIYSLYRHIYRIIYIVLAWESAIKLTSWIFSDYLSHDRNWRLFCPRSRVEYRPSCVRASFHSDGTPQPNIGVQLPLTHGTNYVSLTYPTCVNIKHVFEKGRVQRCLVYRIMFSHCTSKKSYTLVNPPFSEPYRYSNNKKLQKNKFP